MQVKGANKNSGKQNYLFNKEISMMPTRYHKEIVNAKNLQKKTQKTSQNRGQSNKNQNNV